MIRIFGSNRLELFARQLWAFRSPWRGGILLALTAFLAGFTVPAPGAEIGSIQGKFSVSPAGAAGYNVPIPTPGATHGLAPHVGLVYSSRAGNGLVGIGWQLAGISLIARCPPITAREGAPEALSFGSTDRFCLDGQTLLVKTGDYGTDGSTYVGEQDNTLGGAYLRRRG